MSILSNKNGEFGEKMDRFYERFIPPFLVVVVGATILMIVVAGAYKLFH